MKLIRVAAAVLNQTPLDWEGNAGNIRAAIAAARSAQVSILCLPELCITGYGCEDAFQSPGVQQMASRVLAELLPETRGMIVSFGLPLMYGSGLFNVAALAVDGQMLGFVGKQHLAGEGLHYEPRWFAPWPADMVGSCEFQGRATPLGDLVFDCGGVVLGFEVCEDAWVASRPGAALAARGADIILNPSASHFAFGKHDIRQRFVLEGSRAFHVSYVYANLLGNEAGRTIYDGDAMIATEGRMMAVGPRFSFDDYHLTAAVIDIDATRMARARFSSLRSGVAEEQRAPRADFAYPQVPPERQQVQRADWEAGNWIKEEEFARAVSLGLFDYLRKSRSQGLVVSLSGGADSSAVATLVGLFVKFGLEELGWDGMAAKLNYLDAMPHPGQPSDLVRRLLTCVYQSTRNSSETTREAARSVADALGAAFVELDVDPLVQHYIQLAEEAIGRPLTWEQDDLALQNIQARARAPSVWMLANLRNALLLATSNRSEAAVGYATMDGDTAGGLSPIAGIDKAFLRRWLLWMQEHGPEGIGALPALASVTAQQPTAELRPPDAAQTDEGDLMPYDVLDLIERAAIRDKLTPGEVFQKLRAEMAPNHSDLQLLEWVERFFRLWCRNQWKRERYAPSFHLDDENLDPKTWCRFPILSGGFRRELSELRKSLEEPSPEGPTQP